MVVMMAAAMPATSPRGVVVAVLVFGPGTRQPGASRRSSRASNPTISQPKDHPRARQRPREEHPHATQIPVHDTVSVPAQQPQTRRLLARADATEDSIKGTSIDPYDPVWPRWRKHRLMTARETSSATTRSSTSTRSHRQRSSIHPAHHSRTRTSTAIRLAANGSAIPPNGQSLAASIAGPSGSGSG